MPIDVVYEGIALSRATKMMATPAGTFIEMEAPMPVGTRLSLEESGAAVPVRVERVHEGAGPGVFVVPIVAENVNAAAPVEEMSGGDTEPVTSDVAEGEKPDGESNGDSDAGKKGKKKKGKKAR